MRIKVVYNQKKVGQKRGAHTSAKIIPNSHPINLYTDTVYLLRPPRSLSSDRPWIILPTTTSDGSVVLRHPLTSKPYLCNLPRNFNFSKLHPSVIAVSYKYSSFDTVRVIPAPPFSSKCSVDARRCMILALSGGGELRGCPPAPAVWSRLSPSDKLDDIAVCGGQIYAVNRQGIVKLINNSNSIGKTLIFQSVTPSAGRFGWQKRLVVDENDLFLVVRMEEEVFRVFMFKWQISTGYYWDEVWGFKGKKVLFMSKDYYFFRKASRKFPGREYKNCIVFSEAAFPQYGNVGWEFSQFTDRIDQFGVVHEYEIAVFRLNDRVFAREGENSGFPKINWSPPAWIFKASSVPVQAYEFQFPSVSVSSSQLKREPDEAKGLDSVNRDGNDGEVQSFLKVSNSKDKEKQKETETEFGNQHQDQEGVESDSDSQDQEDGKMQCDADTQEKYDGGMHSRTNIEGDASLQEDTVTPSLSAVEEAATINLVTMNNGSDAIEQETSGKNITHSLSVPKASTSSAIEIHKTESATTKFQGFDIRSDLIPTLQKIWRKHGNIIKNSIVRSSDLIAKALESLATIVRILEDNSAQSLSDSQADYLSSTLSDLKCIGFRVYWLVYFVEKALKVHKNKSLVESLNNLSQSSSQVKERKTILLDELAKLNDEENKLREEMSKVSKIFYGQVNFDEPMGAGLT